MGHVLAIIAYEHLVSLGLVIRLLALILSRKIEFETEVSFVICCDLVIGFLFGYEEPDEIHLDAFKVAEVVDYAVRYLFNRRQ